MKTKKTPPPERTGLNVFRTEREPLEKRFLDKWREINSGMYGLDHRHLTYLLSPNQPLLNEPSDRDCQVAETVVQWLGSSVGQQFLRDVLKIDFWPETL